MRRTLLLAALLLSGCSVPTLGVYKMDVHQGNYVTQDMVSKLKPGMTKSQVHYVLGSPLIRDPFHANRWDYLYRHQKGGKVLEERRLVVLFENERLKYVKGDVVPATEGAGEGEAPAATAEQGGDKPSTGAGEKSLLDSVLDKIGF